MNELINLPLYILSFYHQSWDWSHNLWGNTMMSSSWQGWLLCSDFRASSFICGKQQGEWVDILVLMILMGIHVDRYNLITEANFSDVANPRAELEIWSKEPFIQADVKGYWATKVIKYMYELMVARIQELAVEDPFVGPGIGVSTSATIHADELNHTARSLVLRFQAR